MTGPEMFMRLAVSSYSGHLALERAAINQLQTAKLKSIPGEDHVAGGVHQNVLRALRHSKGMASSVYPLMPQFSMLLPSLTQVWRNFAPT